MLSTTPAGDATAIEWNTTITATFDKSMLASTINDASFRLKKGSTVIAGSVSYTDLVATLIPTIALDPNTTYTASMSASAQDLSGKTMAETRTWSFTTVGAPPVALSTTPEDGATEIVRNTSVSVTFDKPMLASSINDATFTLTTGSTAIASSVSYTGSVATLTPTNALDPNTTYTASISADAQDLSGIPLEESKTWSFTTVATSLNGPQPVNLGTAGNYVILAKSMISTTGTTSVVGDLALSPAASSYITGFSLSAPPTTYSTSDLVIGKVWAADYDPPTPTVLTTAVSDMQTAYTDAAGRVNPDFNELGAGDIDGLTLVPGLYKWGTGVSFAMGVTLEGGADDIWIFQVAEDLTVGNGAMLTLSGGAQAKNIYWQVAGAATLGTTSSFKGIILGQTLIALNTGATVTGRLLAQTAVTLDASEVINP